MIGRPNYYFKSNRRNNSVESPIGWMDTIIMPKSGL